MWISILILVLSFFFLFFLFSDNTIILLIIIQNKQALNQINNLNLQYLLITLWKESSYIRKLSQANWRKIYIQFPSQWTKAVLYPLKKKELVLHNIWRLHGILPAILLVIENNIVSFLFQFSFPLGSIFSSDESLDEGLTSTFPLKQHPRSNW